jgi:hypothetical protein
MTLRSSCAVSLLQALNVAVARNYGSCSHTGASPSDGLPGGKVLSWGCKVGVFLMKVKPSFEPTNCFHCRSLSYHASRSLDQTASRARSHWLLSPSGPTSHWSPSVPPTHHSAASTPRCRQEGPGLSIIVEQTAPSRLAGRFGLTHVDSRMPHQNFGMVSNWTV